MSQTLTVGFETTADVPLRVVDWMHEHRLPNRKAAYNLLIELGLVLDRPMMQFLDSYAAAHGLTRSGAVLAVLTAGRRAIEADEAAAAAAADLTPPSSSPA